MSLRLARLRLAGLRGTLPAAVAAAARRHALAAVHPAVAVPVRAAIAVHGVTLMLVVLPVLGLALRHLVPGMAGLTPRRDIAVLLVLGMVRVLLSRRGRLGRGRHCERKRDRTDKNLHLEIS
jgi:hypothetical protein